MVSSHVLLLKTPSAPSPVISNSNLSISHLSLLETSFNESTISHLSHLIRDQQEDWDGVVLCSQRAVKAYEMISDQSGKKKSLKGIHFVVGKQTRNALLGMERFEIREEDVVGSESGNGQVLAKGIIEYFKESTSTQETKRKRLLFLCGDKTNESLPTILAEHALPNGGGGERGGPKIELDSYIVYSTSQSPQFETGFLSYLHDKFDKGGRIWLALCSPSGSKALCSILRKHHLLPTCPTTTTTHVEKDDGEFSESEVGRLRERLTIVAIGGTTKRYLEDEEGVLVDAIAEVPGEEGLVRAVERWEEAHDGRES